MKHFVFLLGQACLVLVLLVFPSCQSSSSEAAKTQDQAAVAPPPPLTVQVAQPVVRTVQRTGQGQGALFAKESVILSNKREGYVERVHVDFGDKVKKGQLLAEMEREELALEVEVQESALRQAEANFIRAQAEYTRAKELAAENLIPEQRLDTNEADYKVMEARVRTAEKILALARKRLRDTRIVSPVNGFVQERFVNPGEYKQDASQLLELVVVNPLKLRAPVPERFAAASMIGMPLRVEVEALPGQVFEGILTRMAARVDHRTRSLRIEAEIPNPDGKLRPGYFAHITGVLGEEDALFIPRTGLARFAGVERIFIVEDNVVTSREVTSGMEDGDWVEIATGLAEGETVAVSALNRLADGMTVQTQEVLGSVGSVGSLDLQDSTDSLSQ
ncbi:MAG: efflux RND transporter periplasmic adaptor subunit [Desulfurellaceae bacterium]|nr:efflux RND transporter periplasmic adaptor subunit [Desulfurellaceae bacterium]